MDLAPARAWNDEQILALHHRAGGIDAARDHFAAPGARRAVDAVEIIGGGVLARAGAAEAEGTPTAGTRRRSGRRAS